MSCNAGYLLLENGGILLLETGGDILLNEIPVPAVAPTVPDAGQSFDSVDSSNPSVEILYTAGKGYFSWPNYLTASKVAWPAVGHAVYTGVLGYWKLPNQLLSLPGNGFLSQQIYTLYASGYVKVPVNAPADVQFNILMEQNAFTLGDSDSFDSIITTSDPMATMPTPVTIPPGTVVTWSLISRLNGLGRESGYVASRFTLTIGCTTYSGKLVSNRGHSSPQIQLSMALQCSGGVDADHPIEAKMTQFLVRRGSR